MPSKLKTKKGIEIFSAGDWNGDIYTTDDLDEMIRAFSETSNSMKPALKLGHTNDQKLLQSDGLPAAGWVGKLYRKGEKLLADFINIPDKIYMLIENKAFNRVSSEIFWDINLGDNKVYKRLLGAVALLGSDLPAVSNLKEIVSLYNLDINVNDVKHYTENNKNLIIKNINKELILNVKDYTMTEVELKALKESLKKDFNLQIETVKKDFKSELDSKDQVIKELKESIVNDKKEYTAKLEVERKEKLEIENDKFIGELEAENLIVPSQKSYVKELLGADKKEYTFKTDKEEKKFSKTELIKEIFSISKASGNVNFENSSLKGNDKSKTDDESVNAEIEKYAKDNKVTYKKAYTIVMNNKK
jgi:hypothetical protein